MDSEGGQKGGGGPATRKPGRALVSPGVRQQADGAQQQDELQTVSHRDSWARAERRIRFQSQRFLLVSS